MSYRSSGRACALIAASAASVLGSSVLGEVNTRIEYQVSPALAETWSSKLDVLPGSSIDIRVRVSYIGTQSPLGLGAVMYQPTISNWDSAGASQDVLAPLATGLGDGDATTSGPYGSVPDAPGQYGRIFGFARTTNRQTGVSFADVGHVQVHNGVNYLRIAKSNVTNWQAGSFNVHGAGGVDTSQWTPGARPTYALPFDTRLTDIVVFKFNITLSTDAILRDLAVTTPTELYAYWETGATEPSGRWVANTTEVSGSIIGEYQTIAAAIHVVPAPATAATLGLGTVLLRRRRR